MIRIVLKLFAFSIYFAFAANTFAIENDDLRAIQKQRQELEVQHRNLVQQEQEIRRKKELELSPSEKAKILQAIRRGVEDDSYEYWATSKEKWQNFEATHQNSFVLILRDLDTPGYFSAYFANGGSQDYRYQGFGLSQHKNQLYVYVNYEDIQIGPEFIPPELYTWHAANRRAEVEEKYESSHPKIKESAIQNEMNQAAPLDFQFRQALGEALAKSEKERVRFFGRIIRDGVPYSWLKKQIASQRKCQAIFRANSKRASS